MVFVVLPLCVCACVCDIRMKSSELAFDHCSRFVDVTVTKAVVKVEAA